MQTKRGLAIMKKGKIDFSKGSNMLLVVVGILVVVGVIVGVMFYGKAPVEQEVPVEQEPVGETYSNEAAKEVDIFIDGMKERNVQIVKGLNPELKEEYSYPGISDELNEYPIYVNCEGNTLPNNENPFATYSWAMLAYASMYDATGDSVYIDNIRETEEKLYQVYNHLKTAYEPSPITKTYSNEYYRSTVIMFHVLSKAYSFLENKNVLSDETKFVDMLRDGVKNIWDFSASASEIMTATMRSTGLSSVSYLFEDSQEKVIAVNLAEKFYLRGKEISELETLPDEPKQECWVKLAEYEYFKASGKSTQDTKNFFDNGLYEYLLDREDLAPALVHPCIEILISLYEDTGDRSYWNKANEVNSIIMERFGTTSEPCAFKDDLSNKFAVRSGFYGDDDDANVYYLSDLSYELYLSAKLGLIK